MDMTALFALLQRAARTDADEAPQDLAVWRQGLHVDKDTLVGAVDAGARAGQLAFAFAGGYQCAIRRLLPELPPDAFVALLLSEGKRQRPDELLTTLRAAGDGRFLLEGEKSWVMGGAAADALLVVATRGVAADGRTESAMILLPAHTAGVTHESRQDALILPALPHGRVRFSSVDVQPGMILPGDGWTRYARPFRTIEDIHVSAAIAAHLAVHAIRREFPPALLATLAACILRLQDCTRADASDTVAHLLLAAAERELQQACVQANELLKQDDDAFARDWRANAAIVGLAIPARQKRLEKALAAMRRLADAQAG
jgi:acyl-CoA dehydrogenase